MKIKWDFDNLFEFGNRLSNYENYENTLKSATQEIAKALHKALLTHTPVVTEELKKGWNTTENLSFTVRKVKRGYMVELTNNVEYARSVNYGHYSYNQFNKGGTPYVVNNRTVPYYAGNKDKTFVFGRFFVEKSIVAVEPLVKQIVQRELQKWLEWCVNGK